MKAVRFSQHALEKFDLFAQRGFSVTQETVIEAMLFPDKIETDKSPPIAQKGISERKVLRVVYIELDEEYYIITFYPGERKRYED